MLVSAVFAEDENRRFFFLRIAKKSETSVFNLCANGKNRKRPFFCFSHGKEEKIGRFC